MIFSNLNKIVPKKVRLRISYNFLHKSLNRHNEKFLYTNSMLYFVVIKTVKNIKDIFDTFWKIENKSLLFYLLSSSSFFKNSVQTPFRTLLNVA